MNFEAIKQKFTTEKCLNYQEIDWILTEFVRLKEEIEMWDKGTDELIEIAYKHGRKSLYDEQSQSVRGE